MAMKKHEACFYLNKLMEEQRETIERADADRDPPEYPNPDGTKRPATEEEVANWARWRDRQSQEAKRALEALDIAAASLTK